MVLTQTVIGQRVGQRVNEIKLNNAFSVRCHLSYFATAVLLFSLCLIGCKLRTWEYSLDSPNQIGLAVVDALNRKDIEKLNRLRVQRKEYESWIFPAFPKSNFPSDFAWNNLNKKCNIGMKRWINRYGDRNLSFVNIRFNRPSESYKGFHLLRGTVLTLQDTSGKKMKLDILGSVVVKDSRYKLLSYDDG